MPKSGKSARPYNRMEKKMAKGMAGQKDSNKKKGKIGKLSPGQKSQHRRELNSKFEKEDARTKSNVASPKSRPGNILSNRKGGDKSPFQSKYGYTKVK